jgi:hypothetical protein
MNIEKDLKTAISNINNSLMVYEKNFSSRLRLEDDLDSKERCSSFEHYIELRFNFESSKIPSLRKLQEETHGHLFVCSGVEEFDEKKRKYKMAHLQLLNPDDIDIEYTGIDVEKLKSEIDNIEKLIGGKNISFNGVQKKIKLVIR